LNDLSLFLKGTSGITRPPYLTILVRPAVKSWSSALHQGYSKILEFYGLKDIHVLLLFVVDGYDECQQLDDAPVLNLSEHLGIPPNAHVKIITKNLRKVNPIDAERLAQSLCLATFRAKLSKKADFDHLNRWAIYEYAVEHLLNGDTPELLYRKFSRLCKPCCF